MLILLYSLLWNKYLDWFECPHQLSDHTFGNGHPLPEVKNDIVAA